MGAMALMFYDLMNFCIRMIVGGKMDFLLVMSGLGGRSEGVSACKHRVVSNNIESTASLSVPMPTHLFLHTFSPCLTVSTTG